ncbi:hypothetical protein LAZ67_19002035 [Cordylochernes scorpioides]|uniref:Reverse transcriptase n=1 Tax=Cordylochernes scorpioides TaxID=51811 RepID=A0ABY6LL16_9ARAC|nr:hypothetical protein LAZ67_19002035 [Cordylochernes scorpioides]
MDSILVRRIASQSSPSLIHSARVGSRDRDSKYGESGGGIPARSRAVGNLAGEAVDRTTLPDLEGMKRSASQYSREIETVAKTKINKNWRIPPKHIWYSGVNTGGALNIRNRQHQTTLTRFRTGHLKPLKIENNNKIYPTCPKCSLAPAAPEQILACIRCTKWDLWERPLLIIKELKEHELMKFVKDRNKEGGGISFLIKNFYYEDIPFNIPNTSDLEAQDYALENTDLNKTNGPDGIHGQMISNLGKNGKERLLDIFNNSLKTGKLPQDWKTETIIPIKKLDKSADDAKNY